MDQHGADTVDADGGDEGEGEHYAAELCEHRRNGADHAAQQSVRLAADHQRVRGECAHDRADECGDHGNENGGGESSDGVRFEEFAEIVQGESAVCVLEGADDHDDGGREQEAGGVGEERDGHAERADFTAMRGERGGCGGAATSHSAGFACLAPADDSRLGGDCCSHGCMRAFIRLLCSEIAL